ncbi:MAG: hypothetical protein JRH11_02330 [Deltaproteobacteria bacterium]|nr:hypothetical protein [Deltaproteobacteria bacterium]
MKSFRPTRKLGLFVILLALVAAALLYRGWTFYPLSLDMRVEHEDYRTLGPGGIVGHGYGMLGTALILTNLLYLARRRIAGFRLGSMEAWLNLHVVTGLVGSMLILFHSAFQLRTPIATVTSVSLASVVLTGIVGRYFYALAPKPDAAQIAANLIALDELVPGLGNVIRSALKESPVTRLPANAPLIRAIGTIPRWVGEYLARRKAVRGSFDSVTRPAEMLGAEEKEAKRILRNTAGLAGAEAGAAAGTALLRSWRGIHRFLAILMILSVSVHIGVAWFYGYRWIWSE